uniref:RING-type E3 ubiquitin transferase n=1 Tax=Cynoglossus semilaevis TaxID=244447 RepID=A0A3P8WQ14_CYNSE
MEPTQAKYAEKHCVLCCQEVEIFAVGKCDHPVCYRCSTKMRVLCEQKYCAVCRVELDKVIFLKKVDAFASLSFLHFPCEKQHGIYFGNEMIYAKYRHLLLSECIHCPEPKVFSRFEELEQHMRKQHELFCCKLCTKHLKIFSYERKWYNRKELARHRAHGDPDDTSHRGHPLCKFCDDRYLDNDELLKHLRRDHYFCHFCDADGSQEYYSDYQYLSEHFRESHYLCEEGRCASEQFTHAFRTEIDYKAHKAAAHSKNRAEARQNRQIDLQFNYAPRQQRRNEGEDYEEVRFNRGGRRQPRGGGGQKSWRYSREEEDRQMEAAMRASMAVRRQEERAMMQERNVFREERKERPEQEEPRHKSGPIKILSIKGLISVALSPSSVKSAPALMPVTPAALKEDDFPSLSTVSVAAPMTPAYSAQPKKSSSFQEEDFPALVSKVRRPKPAAGTASAWSNNTAHNKPTVQLPPPSSRATPPLTSLSSGPQLLSSSSSSLSSSSSRKKKKVGENGKAAPPHSPPTSDDESKGMTQQEFRSVPTMLDISSLVTPSSSNPAPNSDKNTTTTTSAPVSSPATTAVNTKTVETTAQKENVPEKSSNKPLTSSVVAALSSGLANGHPEKPTPMNKETTSVASHPNIDQLLEQEEEFPALITKKPPPGTSDQCPHLFVCILNLLPPPNWSVCLGVSGPKPPPGFTGIPINSNVVETAPPPVPSTGYLVPENFQQRNLELIQSIRKYLHNDESKFNQFKNYSAQFRQGVISAAQYHRSCKDLLGDNFNRIFTELLVLLPDTGKQQELLSAHGDCRAMEKQSGTGGGGGGKKNKNKKNAWQTPTSVANVAAELECQVCPTCRQVLAPKDFNSHKTLHLGEREEFPSLQSISRIIS